MATTPRKGIWYRFIAWFVRTVVFPLTGGLTIKGRENVPKDGALVVACAHVSHLDPPLVGCTCPRELRFMAKEELFKVPVLGSLIRSLGAFPIKRGGSDRAAIKLALDWLEEGRAVLVFPEGQRGDGHRLQPLLAGAYMLAKRSGAAVVPVGLAGTNVVMPRGKSKGRRARVTVVYGRSFTLASLPNDDKDLFATELSTRILAACKDAGLDLEPSAERSPKGGSA